MPFKRLFFCFVMVVISGAVKAQKLDVKVIQDGKVLVPDKDVYHLAPRSFSFQIRSTDAEGFLVGITTDEHLYKSALGEADLEVMWFGETGMAEPLFNKNKEILISDEAPSYWYFTSTEDHRFDLGANGNEKSWQAFRTVSSFYFPDTEQVVSVEKMKKNVYLFFYYPQYDKDYSLIDTIGVFQAQLIWK